MVKAKQFWVLLMINFQVSANFAQVHEIRGKVVDAQDQQPLIGAVVSCGNSRALTDKEGQFSILVSDTCDQLQVRYTSFETQYLDWRPYVNRQLVIFLHHDRILLTTTVVTGTRYEQSLAETPISLSVIKPEFILRNNANSISEALDKVSGVQIFDGQANIRGGSGYSYGAGSRVMLLLNHLPILQSDAGFPNWDDLPLENIAQVEVLKGASSALYGSAAMNGIVHFRTVEPSEGVFTSIQLAPKVFLAPRTEDYWWSHKEGLPPNEMFITLVHRQKLGRLGFSGSGTAYNRLGFRKNNNSTFARVNTAFFFNVHERLRLSLHLNFNKGGSTNYFYWKDKASFEGDPGTLTQSEKLRYTIDPTLTYHSKRGFKHSWYSRYFYVNNNNDGNQSNQSHNFLSEYNLQKEIASLQLKIVAGLSGNYSTVKAQLYGDTVYQFFNTAGFLQLEKKFFRVFHINGGFRLERYQINGPSRLGGKVFDEKQMETRPVFRFGTVAAISPVTFLRMSWGQGFRFPTIAEKYIFTKAGNLSIVPNPAIQSEHGESLEAGFRQAFRLGAHLKGFGDVAYFNSRYRNMIEFVFNSSLQFQTKNVGDTRIQGLECETAIQWAKNRWSIHQLAGYTYLDPRFKEFDSGEKLPVNLAEQGTVAQQNAANSSSFENILKYRTRHIFRYNLDIAFRSWFVGANVNYHSNIVAIDIAFEKLIRGVEAFRRENNTGNTIVGLRAGYQTEKWTVQANLDNAFNELYTLRPALLEAPRSLGLRLIYVL